MFNSFKTIENIVENTKSVRDFLINADWYHAHRVPNNRENKDPETLAEHTELVQEKFVLLCKDIHKLDQVIDKLIIDIIKSYCDEQDFNKIGSYIKKLFVNTIVFHDYGKINVNFQADETKMNNTLFKERKSCLSTHHSALSAYIFIVKHFHEIYFDSDFDKKYKLPIFYTILSFAYPIFKHHSSRLINDIEDKSKFGKEELEEMGEYIKEYQFVIDDDFKNKLSKFIGNVLKKIKKEKFSFSFYNLIRLNFSLLTASDYLASSEYMTGLKIPKDGFGILSEQRKKELYHNIQTKEAYNKTTYQELEGFEFKNPETTNGDELNQLRKEMAVAVIQELRKDIDKNLFYIEAPTGGGKTNLSMIAVAELLNAHEELTKVFYVFPFTTLITQTYQSIIDTLGLEEDEIVQLHSKAGFQEKGESKEDDKYGGEKRNFIDNLFVHYPFCLLTHIKFFDVLKTNKKQSNYLLHRLSNSIVVIDELQTYNPEHWRKVVWFIDNYAKFYNIKFIIMSATLPKIDELLTDVKSDTFVRLLPEAKDKYFKNPNFSGRVTFKFDLLKKGTIELSELAKNLLEKSKEYAAKDFGKYKPKNSVYTIIEFIFKKGTTEFYDEIEKINNGFFEKIFVLSGTILEHRRRHIINCLKNEEYRKKRILLITTQVVEAGVDIDMDLGFKNRSLIDSDEQLAGRINRNVNKKDCELYLFNYNKANVLYGKDKRFEAMKKMKNEYETILAEKDFDRLYKQVFKRLIDWDNTVFAEGFENYLGHIKDLHFDSVHNNFKLIESDNISVFVPLKVPLNILSKDGKEEPFFSKNEQAFLQNMNVLIDEDGVDGESVFDLYVNLITNKKGDFIRNQIELKTLKGIISKYVFSVFSTEKVKNKFIEFSDQGERGEYGYIYLSHHDEIYDENYGLDDSKFNNSENQIL